MEFFDVYVMKRHKDSYELKICDTEIRFYIPSDEFEAFDPKKEYRKGGSKLSLTIENNKIISMKFCIFCYDEEWQSFYDELLEILK